MTLEASLILVDAFANFDDGKISLRRIHASHYWASYGDVEPLSAEKFYEHVA